MNTKTVLIIAGIAVGGYIAYKLYTRSAPVQTLTTPVNPPANPNSNGGTANTINAASGALNELANIFG